MRQTEKVGMARPKWTWVDQLCITTHPVVLSLHFSSENEI